MNGQFKITLEKAVDLIYNYVQHVGEAKTKTLGGTISVNEFEGFFEEKSVFKGKMAWYCYNEHNPAYPELFLAFEQNDDYTSDVAVQDPSRAQLTYPNHLFKYDDGDDSKEAIKEFFKNHLINPSQYPAPSPRISKSTAIGFIGNYRTSRVQNPSHLHQQKLPFAFFENEDDPSIHQLLDQEDIRYIRYYFGYEPVRPINNIRIILVGVDRHGQNIIEYGDPSKVIILDDSWPPPPVN